MFRLTAFLALALAACRAGSPADSAPRAPSVTVAEPSPEPSVPAISWLGRPLHARQLEPAAREALEAKLADAREDLAARPDDPGARVWVGRRLAYLGRFDEAIATYGDGIEQHPEFAPLYRHRGHRHISTRNLAAARADLERAVELIDGTPDEVEPDGMPNARNIPTSTLHTNIWYHLGLVHFLEGEWALAVRAYRACLEKSKNDDMRVATLHWLHMALRRMGRHEEARAVVDPVRADMDIIENTAYHQLTLMYRGDLDPAVLERDAAGDDVQNPALLFGIANHHLVEGDEERAFGIMRRMVDAMRWDAFGTIAAEADLARREGRAPGASPR